MNAEHHNKIAGGFFCLLSALMLFHATSALAFCISGVLHVIAPGAGTHLALILWSAALFLVLASSLCAGSAWLLIKGRPKARALAAVAWTGVAIFLAWQLGVFHPNSELSEARIGECVLIGLFLLAIVYYSAFKNPRESHA